MIRPDGGLVILGVGLIGFFDWRLCAGNTRAGTQRRGYVHPNDHYRKLALWWSGRFFVVEKI